MLKRWTRKQTERYCSQICGRPVTVKFKSFRATSGYGALAFCDEWELWTAERTFESACLWHECAHLLFPSQSCSMIYREAHTHIRAIQLALDRGKIHIANELIFIMKRDWKRGSHLRARKKVLEYFGVI